MARLRLYYVLGLVGAAAFLLVVHTNHSPGAAAVQSDAARGAVPRIVLANTYNAVTKIHFMNVTAHKGSHKPGLVKRRYQADVKYWLMDAKYYDRGELSIGNPTLVDVVRKLGSQDLPENEPTTLPAMAHGIANAVLAQYATIQKVEVRLIHFSKGLEPQDESEDNHVVNIVLER
jgi:hypothetical protein